MHRHEIARPNGRQSCGTLLAGKAASIGKCGPKRELHLAIRIDNYFQVSEFLGPHSAAQIIDAVCRPLRALCRSRQIDRAVVSSGSDGWLDAVFESNNVDCSLLVHACCVGIAATPVRLGKSAILPVLSFGAVAEGTAAEHAASNVVSPEMRRIASKGMPAIVDPAVYKRDMKAATRLFEAINSDSLLLAWQPIRHTYDPADVLYRLASLHLIDNCGALVPTQDDLLSARRIGASGPLDCYMVSRALDELQASSQISLGVNISGNSAKLDFWWTEVVARLSKDRSLGSRLFLEIGSNEVLPPLPDVSAFVDRMRSLGCNIVIGNFGTGYSSIRAMMALKPNAVKIDPLFLRYANQGEQHRTLLNHLVGLGEAIAGTVIVEGIETADASKLARDAGVIWQQGLYQGTSSLSRVWTSSPHDRQIAALKQFRDTCLKGLSASHTQDGVT